MSDLYSMYILDVYALFVCICVWANIPLYGDLKKFPKILENVIKINDYLSKYT